MYCGILPREEYLLKPLSDCGTFTFGHFVIPGRRRRKEPGGEGKGGSKKRRNREINEQRDAGEAKEQGS